MSILKFKFILDCIGPKTQQKDLKEIYDAYIAPYSVNSCKESQSPAVFMKHLSNKCMTHKRVKLNNHLHISCVNGCDIF